MSEHVLPAKRGLRLARPIIPLYATVVGVATSCLVAAAMAAAGAPGLAPLQRGLAPAHLLWPATLALGVLFFVLQRQGFVFQWRDESMKISLDEIAVFLGAVTVPAAHVVLAVGASSLVTQLVHRRAPSKAAFNVAQYTVAASAAMAMVLALRATALPEPLPALAAPIVFAFGTAGLVSLLFSRMGDGRTVHVFLERFGGWAFVGAMLGMSLGLVVYALYAIHPVAVLAAVPVFLYLRRFGRLSEWADDELRTHKLLATVGAKVAGRSDLDTVARHVLTACHALLDCGEAQLTMRNGEAPPRVWREPFAGSAGVGGLAVPVEDAKGTRLGELIVFPRPGQPPYGERERHLLRTVASNAASASANAHALLAAMEANRQLLASERRYRSLFETANVFVHLLDDDGHIVDMNPAAFAALGYTGKEVIARPVQDLLLDGGDLFAQLREKGELRGVEAILRTGSGSEIHVLLDAQALDDPAEGPRYVVSSRDVTSLKRMQAELSISNASQRETIKRLENMNRELEEFTLWTTHDMREPLRSIGTIAQFLHEDIGSISPEEARAMSLRIHDGAERLKERVKALHAFSRIVQADDAFENVPLDAVLDDVVTALEAKVREKGARISLPEQPFPTVRAQPHRIHQVFANLVENALKYGCPDGGEVRLSWRDHGNEWRVCVSDTGPGVPPGFHDRVFQLFQRGPDTKEPGSGAGLAIVKRIVEQHGGRAWVESEAGQGAAFWVALPKAPAGAMATTVPVR